MEFGKGYRTIKISKVWTDGVAGIRYQFAIRMRNKLPRWTNYFHKNEPLHSIACKNSLPLYMYE